MKIKYIQKTTLIDYPGKIACTIFLYGCTFRCKFCYNPELVLKEVTPDIPEQEILDFLEKRREYLQAVCFTGGEPCLSLDKEFLKKIRDMKYLIKIDTNGSLPDKLKEFISAGFVDFVSMDLKSSFEKYSEIADCDVNIEDIKKSIKTISEDLRDYEFRTTIIEKVHTEEEFEKMMKEIKELIGGKMKRFVLQGFKNKGEMISDEYNNTEDTKKAYLNKLKDIAEDYAEKVKVRW